MMSAKQVSSRYHWFYSSREHPPVCFSFWWRWDKKNEASRVTRKPSSVWCEDFSILETMTLETHCLNVKWTASSWQWQLVNLFLSWFECMMKELNRFEKNHYSESFLFMGSSEISDWVENIMGKKCMTYKTWSRHGQSGFLCHYLNDFSAVSVVMLIRLLLTVLSGTTRMHRGALEHSIDFTLCLLFCRFLTRSRWAVGWWSRVSGCPVPLSITRRRANMWWLQTKR